MPSLGLARLLAQGFVARLANIDILAAARFAPWAKIVTAQRAFHCVRDSKSPITTGGGLHEVLDFPDAGRACACARRRRRSAGLSRPPDPCGRSIPAGRQRRYLRTRAVQACRGRPWPAPRD